MARQDGTVSGSVAVQIPNRQTRRREMIAKGKQTRRRRITDIPAVGDFVGHEMTEQVSCLVAFWPHSHAWEVLTVRKARDGIGVVMQTRYVRELHCDGEVRMWRWWRRCA